MGGDVLIANGNYPTPIDANTTTAQPNKKIEDSSSSPVKEVAADVKSNPPIVNVDGKVASPDGQKDVLSTTTSSAAPLPVAKETKELPEPFRVGTAPEEKPAYLDNAPPVTKPKKSSKKKISEASTAGGAGGNTTKKKGLTSKQAAENDEKTQKQQDKDEDVAVDAVDEKPSSGLPQSQPSILKKQTPVMKTLDPEDAVPSDDVKQPKKVRILHDIH